VQGACHDLDQRRLARTILAEQRMNLTGTQLQVHLFECLYARKCLGNTEQFNSRRRDFCHANYPVALNV
jgi:hypothetical protein